MRKYKNSLKGSSLRRYLVISIIIHLALVSLITVGIIKGRHKVEVQEGLFVADILDEQKLFKLWHATIKFLLFNQL